MKLLNKWFSFIIELKQKRFIKDVSIIAGGTATAQLIAIAFSPIITRLYGPEAFGILGVFNSIVIIIVPLATLAYAYAIVLPASDDDAKSLVRLSFSITVVVFIILVLVLLFFHQQIAYMVGFDTASVYLLLIPLVVVLSSFEQILRQWLIRKRQFKSISGIAVIQATTLGGLKSGIGYFYGIAPVLLIINFIGHLLHTVLLWIQAAPSLAVTGEKLSISSSANKNSLTKVASAYRDFPIFRAPQIFINAISQGLPIVLLAVLFGPVPAGYYSLSRRVLKMPSMLISNSVGTVFLPKIAEAANRGEMLRPYIIKATVGLILMGFVPFAVIIALGPWLFGFVFGSEWITAGEYARWLSVWLFIAFLNVPCVQAIPLLGLQGMFLIYEVASVVLRVSALFIGAVMLNSDILALALFSIVGACLNLFLITWVILKSRYSVCQIV